jgi:hypothetical protein
MKKLFVLLVSVFLLTLSSTSFTFATNDTDKDSSISSGSSYDSEDGEDDSDDEDEEKYIMTGSGMWAGKATFKEFIFRKKSDEGKMNGSGWIMKEERDTMKAKIKEMKKDMLDGIKENRDAAKENRKRFQDENLDDIDDVKSGLTDVQKTELEKLKTSFGVEMDALRAKMKTLTTLEEKEVPQAEMKGLAESHYTAVKKILWDDAKELIEKRKEVYEENESLREENRDARKEFRGERAKLVENYKTAFVSRLGVKLDKVSNAKLETILTKVNTMIPTYEANASINATKKDKILGQLVALKEIIEEKIETDDVETEVLDLMNELTQ